MRLVFESTVGTTGKDCQASGSSVAVAEAVDKGTVETTVGIADVPGARVTGIADASLFAPIVGEAIGELPAQAAIVPERKTHITSVDAFRISYPLLFRLTAVRDFWLGTQRGAIKSAEPRPPDF
jgi:hypothetical protein